MAKKLIARMGMMLLATMATEAQAEFVATVAVKTTPLPSGRTRYEYTVTNISTDSEKLSGFALDIGENASIKSISKRREWQIIYSPEYASPYNRCGPSIEWNSTDSSVDLPPGSQSVFSFTSRLAPSTQFYSVYGWGRSSRERPSQDGRIATPGKAVACDTQ